MPVIDAVKAQYAIGPAAGSGKVFVPGSTLPGPAGLPLEHAQAAPLALSIDDAISIGLARNLRLRTDVQNQRIVKGDFLLVANALIPTLELNAASSTQEVNLAAMGFNPSKLNFPGILPGQLKTIVKIDTTQATLSLNQQLFNVPAYELYRGAKDESAVVALNQLAARGDLVVAIGTAYLKILADQSNVANAQALEKSAKQLFDNATAKQQAGAGIHLDTLRAQVEYQNRLQQRVSAEGDVAKDTIQLNRIMGIPAEQQLQLTDTAPFAQLADMDLERARATAYERRKDYLSLQAQVRVADRERLAAKYARLPVIAFGGYYGVLGETEGLYHGVFRAAGSVNFPIFREAAQRGDEEVISAQLMSLRQREQSVRVDIDAQIRAALLDVQSYNEQVRVSQSSVDLAQQELSDEQARFAAGVEDNLPVVDAQAQLAGAQAQLVRSLYQFNGAKLQLARATGIVETQYRTYLGTAK